jgi:hypothetical protein
MSTDLQLEIRETADTSQVFPGVYLTPLEIGEDDYWLLRVKVSDKQAIIGFPKFGTIGVGFLQEEDWNTNLPYDVGSEGIWEHIRHNKGDDTIPDERCLEALKLVCDAATKAKSA